MKIVQRRPSRMLTYVLTACTLLVSAITGSTPTQAAGEMKPVAIVALSSVNQLLEDANFLASMANSEQMIAQVQPMVMGFTQGIDTDRPIGLIAQTDDGANYGAALCIPVTDLQATLNLVKNFGVEAEAQPDGTMQISFQGQTIFAKETNGWALLSMMPQMLEGMPDDPEKLFSTLTAEYDLGVRLFVQNIPEAYRNMAIEQLQQGMNAGFQQQGQEDTDLEASKELAELQITSLKQIINESDEVTFGMAIDGEQQRALIEFAMTAAEGTELAKQLGEKLADQKTDFAGFYQPDAAMMISFAAKVTEAEKTQMEQTFEAMRSQIRAAIDQENDLPSEEARELAHSAVDDFLDAFKSTLQAGMMDGGAVLNMAPKSLTLVAGGFIADPGKVESGLKKLEQLSKDEPDFPGINWNFGSHADVKFHTINVPIPEDDEEPREIFGDTIEMVVGIGTKSVFFGLGDDCIEAVKGVMDESASTQNKKVAPIEMTFALKQIMDFAKSVADEDEKAPLEMISNMLENEAHGRDHVRIVVSMIDNGFKYRIEAEEGVLRAIGTAVMLEQMEAAGQGF